MTDPLQNRRGAQKRILAEHVFNTLADRMWLYAAGLLLIDVVLRIDPAFNPIAISSTYGLVLSVVKVMLVGPVGSLVDRMPRWWAVMVPLLVQNISVALNALCIGKVTFGEEPSLT